MRVPWLGCTDAVVCVETEVLLLREQRSVLFLNEEGWLI